MKHVFSLGAEYDVCERCGSDLDKQDPSAVVASDCPGSTVEWLPSIRGKIVRAAIARGFTKARSEIFALLEAQRVELEGKNEPLRDLLRDVTLSLPRWKDT
jgi:hypothetical protein